MSTTGLGRTAPTPSSVTQRVRPLGPNLAKADFLAKESQRRQKYPQNQCVMPTHARTDPVGSKKVRTVHGQRSFECLEASISTKAR